MFKKIAFHILLIATLLTPTNSNSSFAAETVVLNTTTGGAPACDGYLPLLYEYGIRVLAGQTTSVTKIILLMNNANANNYVDIRSTNATGTNGNLIGNFTYSSKVSSGSFYLVTFIGTANLNANSEYWIIPRESTQTGYQTCYDSSAPTTASGFAFVKTSTSYQYSFGNTQTFTDNVHFDFVLYAGAADSTPPTITSSDSFVLAENQTNIATITTSESATISIFGGVDQAKFSLTRLDTSSALLAFASAPNFEAPTDTGLNNTYVVVLRATDPAGNAGYETVTATVIDVDENARLLSYSVSGAQTKGQITTLVATVNVPGKVTFLVNGKRIVGCIGKPTAGSGPITATCQWKSALRGNVSLTFTIVPSAVNYVATTSQPSYLVMGRRVNTR